jgi:hypothetical protein
MEALALPETLLFILVHGMSSQKTAVLLFTAVITSYGQKYICLGVCLLVCVNTMMNQLVSQKQGVFLAGRRTNYKLPKENPVT